MPAIQPRVVEYVPSYDAIVDGLAVRLATVPRDRRAGLMRLMLQTEPLKCGAVRVSLRFPGLTYRLV